MNGDSEEPPTNLIPFPGSMPANAVEVPEALTEAEALYTAAMDQLAEAEVAEAEQYLVRKHEVKPPRSDWEARAMAVIDTGALVTKTRAMTEVYLARTRR